MTFLSYVSIILRSQPSWTSWGLCFISFPHASLPLQLSHSVGSLSRLYLDTLIFRRKLLSTDIISTQLFPYFLCTVKFLSCFKFVFCLMCYSTHPSLFSVPISIRSFLPRSLMVSALPYQRIFCDSFTWYLGTIITSYCSSLEQFSCGFWETICLWFSFLLPGFSFSASLLGSTLLPLNMEGFLDGVLWEMD